MKFNMIAAHKSIKVNYIQIGQFFYSQFVEIR